MAGETPFERIERILAQCSFPTFEFAVSIEGSPLSPTYFMRVQGNDAVDTNTGERTSWVGRKWRLSQHMTDGEIVQTAWTATLQAIEHEAREQFKFMGQSVFDPHYDIYKLVALRASADAIKERDNAHQDHNRL